MDNPPDDQFYRLPVKRADADAMLAAAEAAGVRVDVSGLQPHPLTTMMVQINVGSGVATAITRYWNPFDVPRCRLCPRCTAFDSVCTVVVGAAVQPNDAALFSLHRRLIRAGGDPPQPAT